MNIIIENVVANATISGYEIKKILESIPETQYRPNRFPALGVNVGKSKVWLYDSGKVTSAGSKSRDEAIDSINDFVGMLEKLGMRITILSTPKIVNIIANTILSNLDMAQIKCMKEFIREIPAFGAILSSFENHTSIRIYQNGAIMASNNTIKKIIHSIKELKKYQTKS